MIGPNSRYLATGTGEWTSPNGEKIPFLRRRLLPPASAFALLFERRILSGERLDRITASVVDDPELFWQLADSNGVMQPHELEIPDRIIRVTMPFAVPGAQDTEGSGND